MVADAASDREKNIQRIRALLSDEELWVMTCRDGRFLLADRDRLAEENARLKELMRMSYEYLVEVTSEKMDTKKCMELMVRITELRNSLNLGAFIQ